MLTLRIQEIGASLSDGTRPEIAPAMSVRDGFGWLDSSLDLKSGLDVLDLSGDLRLPDLKEPPIRPHER